MLPLSVVTAALVYFFEMHSEFLAGRAWRVVPLGLFNSLLATAHQLPYIL
jgi:hypothetical protein